MSTSDNTIERGDLLIELGTEELPPIALPKLSAAFKQSLTESLEKAGFDFNSCQAFAAPRRLGLLFGGLRAAQADQQIERRGPAVSAAFDEQGQATPAGLGFARSCGVDIDALERRETSKGSWLFYQATQAGKRLESLLQPMLEKALNALPIPKRMRWGSSEISFVRPVHWLVVLFNDQILDCELLGLKADRLSYGHRVHSTAALRIEKAADYESLLETDGFVIADFARRRERIEQMVHAAAKEHGGEALADNELLDEICALVEWPQAIVGAFEERFLEVPHEALIYTMKKNQKYVPIVSASGELMPQFITIANIQSQQPELIREGNERVVRPRLADAAFFWEQDCKTPLASRFDKLANIVFQDQLGSLADKTQRVEQMAAHIAEQIGANVDHAQRAAHLSRCDLVTDTVVEFPQMQGIMGRYLAQRDQEAALVATACDGFYQPRFAGDALPDNPVAASVALADKLDTLCGIFAIGSRPTGDKDPYALRRAALGILRILREQSLDLELRELLQKAVGLLPLAINQDEVVNQVMAFLLERYRGLVAEAGYSAEQFLAVAAVEPATIVNFEARLQAVRLFTQRDEAQALAAANKRIGNLLKKAASETGGGAHTDGVDSNGFEHEAESALHRSLNEALSDTQPLLEQQQYVEALDRLASLREPVDQFFDAVMVMADDPKLRRNRLALLANLKAAFGSVADISLLS